MMRSQAYRSRVEIVRNGVLESVAFPAPLAIRDSVDNVHVVEGLRPY